MNYLKHLFTGLVVAIIVLILGLAIIPSVSFIILAIAAVGVVVCFIIAIAITIISLLNLWTKLVSLFEDCTDTINEDIDE